MPFVQVCHHGLKRQRGHWSIELFQSKRCAIQLAAERSGRKAGSSKGKWRDDKEKGYQEQSQSSWGKQKWRPDEEDRDGDTSQPRSNKDASDDCSKSSSEEPMSNSSATRSYDHSWSDNSCCKEPTFSSNGGSLRIVLDPRGVMTDPQIWIMVAKVFQRRSSVIRR